MITTTILMACTGANRDRAEQYGSALVRAMNSYEIDTPKRIAPFLANVGHESAGLKYATELWGPTPQQRRYERDQTAPWPSSPAQAKEPAYVANRLAYSLGNSEQDDGFRFRGRGLIQVTGRSNYAACGKALGLDLVAQPERLADPDLAARSAGWFWDRRGLNAFADREDFETIVRRINGGLNGYDERLRLYRAGLRALG